MKYLDLKNNYTKEELIEAANYIKNGKLVLFPTETVYGIGADALNEQAVENIFKAKNRKPDNPLILHVSSIEMVKEIAEEINDIETLLMEKFFPGPLTIIFPKKSHVPYIATGNLETVGIRMPSNKIAHDLIELSNTPIAAPSANISGRPSGTNVEDILEELKDKVDYIIDEGKTSIGVESTVIRVINDEIHILRPGKITKEDLEKVYPKVIIDKHILSTISEQDKVLSPGMKYKHYAPNSKCVLVYSNNKEKLINKMQQLEQENKNNIVLCRTENKKYFKNCICMGNTEEEIMKNIFTILRKVDSYEAPLVIIEGVAKKGLGLAIMNRLIRACSHNYIEL